MAPKTKKGKVQDLLECKGDWLDTNGIHPAECGPCPVPVLAPGMRIEDSTHEHRVRKYSGVQRSLQPSQRVDHSKIGNPIRGALLLQQIQAKDYPCQKTLQKYLGITDKSTAPP